MNEVFCATFKRLRESRELTQTEIDFTQVSLKLRLIFAI